MGLPKIVPPPVPRLVWPSSICPIPVTESNRIIGEIQIYDLENVKELVKMYGIIVLNDDTDQAMKGGGRNPLPPPDWSVEELQGAILSLIKSDYKNSQWCKLNTNKYLDCDSYVLYYSRSKKNRAKEGQGLKLYIKFGFMPNASHPRGIICRFHPTY